MRKYNHSFFAKTICIAILVLTSHSLLFGQEVFKPYTKEELISICNDPVLKDFPDKILKNVQKNKIAFLPTKKEITFLIAENVPQIITNALKFNFASSLVYRVCKFEPVDGIGGQFTKELNDFITYKKVITQSNSQQNGLLGNKTFQSNPASSSGLNMEELKQYPNNGYLLIMGDIRDTPGSNNKTVTARLVFVSRVQVPMDIAIFKKEMGMTMDSQKQIAKEIAEWSIDELERQIE